MVQIAETAFGPIEVFVSNAVLGGRYVLRACIVNFRTALNDVVMEGERYHLSATSDGFFPTRAAEAAGLQGKFFEMHDVLYLQRGNWLGAGDPRPQLEEA